MAYRVRQSDEAHRDLIDILTWLLEQDAGEAGLRWFIRLEEAMETLSELPQRCPLVLGVDTSGLEVRQLIHGHKPHFYRVLFTIEDDFVVILQVRHGRRLPVRPN